MARTSLLKTGVLNAMCRDLKAMGYGVVRDKEAGTIVASCGDVVVLRAIQKGRGQPWIATFIDSDNIKWKWDNA